MTTNVTPNVFIDDGISAIVPASEPMSFDPIAGTGIPPRSNSGRVPITLESDRRTSDYSVSTYRTNGDTMYVQYQNNLVTPVTYRPNVDNPLLTAAMGVAVGGGVYIVERYSIPTVCRRAAEEFVNYYQHTDSIAYDDATIEHIRDLVCSAINKRGALVRTELRIVTHVPAKTLIENQLTYIRGPGIVVIHGDVPEELCHPYSPAYLEDTLLTPVDDTGSVTIDITIIDNDNKPYYYMVGNDPRVIRPISGVASTVLPTGATVVHRRGSDTVTEDYTSLNDMESNGFYRSRELCVASGNAAHLVERVKHEHELEKLKLALATTTEGNRKLLLERGLREELSSIELSKKRSDYEYSVATKQMDLTILGTKGELDAINRLGDIRTAGHKVKTDLLRTELEYRRSKDLHSMKMSDQLLKTFSTIFSIFK